MKKIITLSLSIAFLTNSFAQKHVGINTTNPLAALHVADSSVLFTGPATLPVTATPPPVSGAGNRMFWYADNAAFRAGGVAGTQWDKTNVGQYSFAVGLDSKASQYATTALGNNCVASANYATAMGRNTISSGGVSTAMGFNTTASNTASTAMGNSTTASGLYSTAMGNSTSASGSSSIAIGSSTNAVGSNSFAAGTTNIAFGINTIAAGDNSNAVGDNSFSIGHYARAIGEKSFALGDSVRANGYVATAMGYQSIADGEKSFAVGDSVSAKGYASTAMGYQSLANHFASTAMGYQTWANNDAATAMGYQTIAGAEQSTAMGYRTSASNVASTAMGFETTASGTSSTSMGFRSNATGYNSTAMGSLTTASGGNSTAMGVQASTNGHSNSFCISGKTDFTSTPLTLNTQDNQMMMRFDNYTFWVSAANYAYLIPASNGWAYTSDRNKKERLEELNGETVLNKIASIPFYSWNFKDPATSQYRHYGIMAQDFYNAFGKDNYGNIGNDTTVSPLDLLGVAYSAIKELEKRSASLTQKNKQLDENNLALQKEIAGIKEQYTITNVQLTNKIAVLETRLNQLMAIKEQKDASKEIVVNK